MVNLAKRVNTVYFNTLFKCNFQKIYLCIYGMVATSVKTLKKKNPTASHDLS